MYNITLSKLQGGDAIRTDVTVGVCDFLPVVGKSFQMIANGVYDDSPQRWVTTSVVKAITGDNEVIVFKTLNSIYQIIVN